MVPEVPKKDASVLINERERFIRKAFVSLTNGEHIRLSDFLIEGEALDWNIRATQEGGEKVSIAGLKSAYFGFVSRARELVRGEKDKVQALFNLAHDEYLKTYYWPRDSIIDVLMRKSFNCSSTTEFFTVLLEDVLGLQPRLIVFSDHVKTYLNGKGIENTADFWNDAVRPYDGCGLITGRHAFIANYLVAHGVGVDELPPTLLAAKRPKEWPGGCGLRAKEVPTSADRMPLGSMKAALFVGLPTSGLSIPPYPRPSGRPSRKPTLVDIEKMAQTLFAAYRISRMEEDAFDTERSRSYVDVAAFTVPKGVDWKMLFDTYGYWDKMAPPLYAWPQHLKRYFTIPSISVSFISSLAELFPKGNGPEAMPYFRKNICARYKAALSSRDMVEISNYLRFDFCTGLNQELIKLYRETRNPDLLRYGIGKFMLPENYDFLLSEFSSTDPDVKRKAAGGLVLSDAKRACATLGKLQESERRIIATQLIVGCGDKTEIWNSITRRDLYQHVPLTIPLSHLSGSDVSREQLAVLHGLERTASPLIKIILARFFFEVGDHGRALSTLSDAVRRIQANTYPDTYTSEEFEGMVPEFIHILSPLFTGDIYSISIAKGLDGAVPYPSYPPELIASLRRIYKNEEKPIYARFEAAFLLLKFGYHFE